MRNPHASNLRHHKQQIIPDKREASAAELDEREMRELNTRRMPDGK